MQMKDFVEIRIIGAVRELLSGRVNELLSEMECPVPLIEFSEYKTGRVVVPVISLACCERLEKERILRLDTYSLTITFSFSETLESELFCYAYSGAVGRAFYDDPTLSGVVDRAVVIGMKYFLPKKAHCGESWGIVVSVRITVEGMYI
jgi:hypothetical protein